MSTACAGTRAAGRGTAAAVLLALAVTAADGAAQAACTADTPVRLDHVVVAVASLESAAAAYREAGFTLKEGRLHANGLLNRHAKFADGTGIELMSLGGPASDAMARDYAGFIEAGDGGAYVALSGPAERVRRAARAAGLDARVLEAGGFRYVTFGEPELAQVFFIEQAGVPDTPAITTHANGGRGLRHVGLEGGPGLAALLEAVGARRCDPAGDEGSRAWALGGGRTLTLLPLPPGARPRIRWISVGVGPDGAADTVPAERAGGVRIGLTPDP